MTRRPVLFVLAGVNGAGKSSIGGDVIRQAHMTWFNPDDHARELVDHHGYRHTDANAAAWNESLRRLDHAIAEGRHYAFETTLGGTTMPQRIRQASRTHDVLLWFCGLSSPEQHIARVQLRVSRGGHDIPEDRIRKRFARSPANLINLMPSLAALQVYDNSADVAAGEAVPDPVLVLEMAGGRVRHPDAGDRAALAATPGWAAPIVEAALKLHEMKSSR